MACRFRFVLEDEPRKKTNFQDIQVLKERWPNLDGDYALACSLFEPERIQQIVCFCVCAL